MRKPQRRAPYTARRPVTPRALQWGRFLLRQAPSRRREASLRGGYSRGLATSGGRRIEKQRSDVQPLGISLQTFYRTAVPVPLASVGALLQTREYGRGLLSFSRGDCADRVFCSTPTRPCETALPLSGAYSPAG